MDCLDQLGRMETQAWVVIVADADGKGLAKTFELMSATVNLVQTETEAVTLLRHSKRAPNFLHILADELGGLERAIRLHQQMHWQSGFWKFVILSNDGSNGGLDPESPQIFLLPKAPKLTC